MISTTESEVLGWVARATGLLLGHIHAIQELISSLEASVLCVILTPLCGSVHIPALVSTLCVCLPVSISNVSVAFYGHVLPRVSMSDCSFPGPKHRACIVFQYYCCLKLSAPLSLVPTLPQTAWEDT